MRQMLRRKKDKPAASETVESSEAAEREAVSRGEYDQRVTLAAQAGRSLRSATDAESKRMLFFHPGRGQLDGEEREGRRQVAAMEGMVFTAFKEQFKEGAKVAELAKKERLDGKHRLSTSSLGSADRESSPGYRASLVDDRSWAFEREQALAAKSAASKAADAAHAAQAAEESAKARVAEARTRAADARAKAAEATCAEMRLAAEELEATHTEALAELAATHAEALNRLADQHEATLQSALRAAGETHEGEIAALRRSLAESTARHSYEVDEIRNSLRAGAAAAEERLRGEIESLAADYHAVKTELSVLRTDAAERAAKVKDLTEQLAAKAAEAALLSVVQAENEALRTAGTAASDSSAAAAADLLAEQARASTLQANVDELTAAAAVLRASLEASEAEAAALRAAASAAEALAREQTAACEKARERAEKLAERVEAAEKAKTDAKRDEKQRKELQAAAKDAAGKVKTLDDQLAAADAARYKAQAAADAAAKELKALRKAAADDASRREKAEKLAERRQAEARASEAGRAAAAAEAARTAAAMRVMEATVAALEDRAEKMHSELQEERASAQAAESGAKALVEAAEAALGDAKADFAEGEAAAARRLDSLRGDNDMMTAALQAEELNANQLASELTEVKASLEDAAKRAEALQHDNQEQELRTKQLAAELDAAKASLEEATKSIENLQLDSQTQAATSQEQELRAKQLAAELDEAKASLEEATKRIEGLQHDSQTEAAAFQAEELRTKQLAAELDEAKASLEEATNRIESLQHDDKTQTAALRAELAEAKTCLDDSRKETAELLESKKTQEAALQAEQHNTKRLEAELVEAKTCLDESRSEKDQLQAELDRETKAFSASSDELQKSALQKVHDLEVQLATLQQSSSAEIARLASENTEALGAVESLRKELEAGAQERDTVSKQAQAVEAELAALQQSSTAEIARLAAENTEARGAVESLRKELEAGAQEQDGLSKQAQAIEEELAVLQQSSAGERAQALQTVESLRSDLAAGVQERDALSRQAQAAEASLGALAQSSAAEVSRVTEEKKEALQQAESLREKLEAAVQKQQSASQVKAELGVPQQTAAPGASANSEDVLGEAETPESNAKEKLRAAELALEDEQAATTAQMSEIEELKNVAEALSKERQDAAEKLRVAEVALREEEVRTAEQTAAIKELKEALSEERDSQQEAKDKLLAGSLALEQETATTTRQAAEIASLSVERDTLLSTIAAAEKKEKDAQIALEDATAGQMAKIQELKKLSEVLTNERDTLQRTVAHQSDENARALESQSRTLNETHETQLNAERNDATTRLTEQEQAYEDLSTHHKDAEAKLSEIQQQLEAEKKVSADVATRLTEQEQAYEDLSTRHKAQDTLLREAEAKLRETQQQLEAEKEVSADATSRLTDQRQASENLSKDQKTHETLLLDVEAKLCETQQQLEAERSVSTDLRHRLTERDEAFETLSKEQKTHEARYQETEAKLRESQQQLESERISSADLKLRLAERDEAFETSSKEQISHEARLLETEAKLRESQQQLEAERITSADLKHRLAERDEAFEASSKEHKSREARLLETEASLRESQRQLEATADPPGQGANGHHGPNDAHAAEKEAIESEIVRLEAALEEERFAKELLEKKLREALEAAEANTQDENIDHRGTGGGEGEDGGGESVDWEARALAAEERYAKEAAVAVNASARVSVLEQKLAERANHDPPSACGDESAPSLQEGGDLARRCDMVELAAGGEVDALREKVAEKDEELRAARKELTLLRMTDGLALSRPQAPDDSSEAGSEKSGEDVAQTELKLRRRQLEAIVVQLTEAVVAQQELQEVVDGHEAATRDLKDRLATSEALRKELKSRAASLEADLAIESRANHRAASQQQRAKRVTDRNYPQQDTAESMAQLASTQLEAVCHIREALARKEAEHLQTAKRAKSALRIDHADVDRQASRRAAAVLAEVQAPPAAPGDVQLQSVSSLSDAFEAAGKQLLGHLPDQVRAILEKFLGELRETVDGTSPAALSTAILSDRQGRAVVEPIVTLLTEACACLEEAATCAEPAPEAAGALAKWDAAQTGKAELTVPRQRKLHEELEAARTKLCTRLASLRALDGKRTGVLAMVDRVKAGQSEVRALLKEHREERDDAQRGLKQLAAALKAYQEQVKTSAREDTEALASQRKKLSDLQAILAVKTMDIEKDKRALIDLELSICEKIRRVEEGQHLVDAVVGKVKEAEGTFENKQAALQVAALMKVRQASLVDRSSGPLRDSVAHTAAVITQARATLSSQLLSVCRAEWQVTCNVLSREMLNLASLKSALDSQEAALMDLDPKNRGKVARQQKLLDTTVAHGIETCRGIAKLRSAFEEVKRAAEEHAAPAAPAESFSTAIEWPNPETYASFMPVEDVNA